MAVRGIFTSYSSLVGDRQTNDFAGRLLMNGYGGMVPMLALSSGMGSDRVTNTEFSWVEDSWISGNATVTVGGNSAAVSLTVDDANIWIPNSILMNQTTGEHLFMTARTGNVITVVRGFQNTTPATVTNGDKLQLISTAFAEASGGADSVVQVGESRTNYVQIFKAKWSVSNTAKAVNYRTGNKVASSKAQATTQLSESIERAFMFGRPYAGVDPVSGKRLYTSGGIRYNIETYGGIVQAANANSVAGRLNLDLVTNFIRRIFDRNVKGFPNERLTFTGSYTLELLQKMVQDVGEYSISQGESVYGMNVTKLRTFAGELSLLTHPMFVENEAWGREIWVMHPAGIKRKILRGIEIVEPGDNREDALDATEGHIRTELGFEVSGVKCMGLITNIQTAGGLAALPNS